MFTIVSRSLLPLSLWLCSAGAAAQGTGSYLNFESPQLDPVVCTTTGARSWLLACNTPDNSVEVYSTLASWTSPTFVVRVPTGLEPVTIAVKPTLLEGNVRRCYVAGWLSDSITIFDLTPSGVATLVRTERVGDEPIGIAFAPEDESLIVTFSAQGAWGWFDAATLQPVQPGYGHRELFANARPVAIEDPRAVAFSPASSASPNIPGQLFVLNFRGGSDPARFDYDLWSGGALATAAATQTSGLPDLSTPGSDALGSTNFNMAFAPNGDLYVVAQHARNKEHTNFVLDAGVIQTRALVTGSTGFVTSQLVRVRGAGTASPVVERIDLNSTNPSQYPGTQAAMPITQPTDVAVKGDGTDDSTRIFVTGFNSDTVGMVQPTGSGTWSVARIDVRHPTLPFPSASITGIMRGPRGLALNGPQSHVYVLNRLENSVTVLDANFNPATPSAAVLNTFALQEHPVPDRVKNGRAMLYSSRLSGGNNASCASCHIDGNSDFLAWNLADGTHIPSSPNDTNVNKGGDPQGLLGPNSVLVPGSVQDIKGPLQTQSLRGLVNFEIGNPLIQDYLFSNAPYHWRGDKALFIDFNEAFDNLLAIPNPVQPGTKGIPDAAMEAFRDFVSSVHYPPNPDQPVTRVYSGSMTTPNPSGSASPLDDTMAGSGALRGFKNMHIESSDGGDNGELGGTLPKRGCITCHSLPEGSNNRFTDRFAYAGTPLDTQRLETTALRGLGLKERELWRFDPVNARFAQVQIGGSPVRTGEFGLIHTGDTTMAGMQGGLPGPFQADSLFGFLSGFPSGSVSSLDATVSILRELDTGVAPIIGQVVTVDATSNLTTVNAALDLLEGQARKANAGVAVATRLAGLTRGFWYDVRSFATTPYTEEGNVTPLAPMSRATLLAFAATSGNVLVFQSTPLGSARRVARPRGGLPAALGGGPPAALVLQGCKPGTANVEVPLLQVNWFDTFTFGATIPGNVGTGFASRLDLNIGNNKSLVWFQASLIHHAATAVPAGFGLTGFHHEPPRRFVVTGTGIQEGALLRLYLPKASDFGATAPTGVPNSSTHPHPIEVPIYAAEIPDTGAVEWQSAVEIEPYQLFALMNGGRASSEVQNAKLIPDSLDTLSPPLIPTTSGSTDYFRPLERNWYYVEVVNDPANPSTTTAAGGWQRLTIQ